MRTNEIVKHIEAGSSSPSGEWMSIVGGLNGNSHLRDIAVRLVWCGMAFASMPMSASALSASYANQSVQDNIIIECVKSSSFAHSTIRTQLSRRIEEMRTLQEGWVPGGRPITPSAIDYASMIIAACSDEELEHWNIGPYVNGTVMMNYRANGKLSAINIGKSTISAFMKVGSTYKAIQEDHQNGREELIKLIRALQG